MKAETKTVLEYLDAALPDSKVIADARAILHSEQANGYVSIEVEDGHIKIPIDVPINIVTKALFKEYYPIGFGTGYRVQAHLGEVVAIEHGILLPEYGFVTLYYNERGQRFTVDFHLEMR